MEKENPELDNNYAIGDLLGKGAFGSVYKGLNLSTGEIVAIKQIRLTNTPKAQLNSMMMEIDLLKKLNHKHIVRYIGFFKTKEHLNILIEFCESGSLIHLLKKFGHFTEKLVGMYTSQVLEGLKYLHDQGVIHRDIKAANLLTDKQGVVKLADFGIASTTNGDQEVAGSPYWMAPEIVELNGATTASDIWSLGSTVIELLTGNPPYIEHSAMSALFRIVQDDCPPLPPQASEIVKDFLQQCFQKDPNLRVTAQKLMKHPWMVQSRRKDLDITPVVPKNIIPSISKLEKRISTGNDLKINSSLSKYSEEVEDNWANNFEINLAISIGNDNTHLKSNPIEEDYDDFFDQKPSNIKPAIRKMTLPGLPISNEGTKKIEMQKFIEQNELDDFFEENSTPNEIALNSPEFDVDKWEESVDEQAESGGLELTKSIKQVVGRRKQKRHVNSLFKQSNSFASERPLSGLDSFTENETDDFSDIVSPKLTNSSLRLKQAISFDDEEEEDPFLISDNEENQDFSDYALKDIKAKNLSELMKSLDRLLPGVEISEVHVASKNVLDLITLDPELKKTVVGYHGMIPIIELLSSSIENESIETLLKVINSIAVESPDILENICLVGAIPIVLKFSSNDYPSCLLKEVAKFINLLNLTKPTLQMFVISNGFKVLITMLQIKEDHEIIFIAIDAIRNIFDLPMKSIKNDLCRMFIKYQILTLLIDSLYFTIRFRGSESVEYSQKILNIFVLFSQSDITVKRSFSDPKIIHGNTTSSRAFKINGLCPCSSSSDYFESH
eukprot:NODE_455_length_7230_cov_0.733277.p2 type:complete len:782 gc:universal NODE_455_length_7230_cov_0.733277:3839-6184(+)